MEAQGQKRSVTLEAATASIVEGPTGDLAVIVRGRTAGGGLFVVEEAAEVAERFLASVAAETVLPATQTAWDGIRANARRAAEALRAALVDEPPPAPRINPADLICGAARHDAIRADPVLLRFMTTDGRRCIACGTDLLEGGTR